MSMAASFIVGNTSTGLPVRPYNPRIQALTWGPISRLGVAKQKDRCCFSSNALVLISNNNNRNIAVYASSVPGPPLPSGPPSSSIMSWILGMVVSIVLPFFTHKWGPLWVIKNRIDNTVQQVEDIVRVVEKVAEEVDKIAEEMVEELPDGKLKNIAHFVEDIAEKTAKNADSLGDMIDKVQEAEETVECIVESIGEEAKKSPNKDVNKIME